MKKQIINIVCLCTALLLTGCSNVNSEENIITIQSTMYSGETYTAYSEPNSTTEKRNSENSAATVSESTVGIPLKTEFSGKATESISMDTQTSEEEPTIVYGTGSGLHFEDDFVADPGEIYLSLELKNAIDENSDNSLALFAIYIDVYDYNAEHRAETEEFLNNTVIDDLTYAQINEKRGEIDEEIKRLREISDIYLNPDITEEQVTEYSNKISELTNEDQYYYEIVMDMLIAADRYSLQLESDRLEELGIDVCGITENRRNTNYIIAIVSAEEINSMPFSDDVGYKIWLVPET